MALERHSMGSQYNQEMHERGVQALEKIGNNLEDINVYIKDFMGFIKDEIEDEKAYVKSLTR